GFAPGLSVVSRLPRRPVNGRAVPLIGDGATFASGLSPTRPDGRTETGEKTMTAISKQNTLHPADTVIHGDCIDIMRGMEANSVDMILTDPPYITRYRSRDGQSVRNDDNSNWLAP